MYYIIEKYDGYEDRPCGSKYTKYDVRECRDEQDLQKKFLQGPKHGGTLTAARELEVIVNFEIKEKALRGRESGNTVQFNDHYSGSYS